LRPPSASLWRLLREQEQLAAAKGDGKVTVSKHEFDLSPDDWAEMAKTGSIKYRIPCYASPASKPSAEQIDQRGLSPDEVAAIEEAYAKSNQRLWSQVKPLCVKTIGSAEVAEKLGPDTCAQLILDIAEKEDRTASLKARRMVGEIRAGKRAAPGQNDPAHPVLRLFLALTGELASFEADLARELGPEEAHRFAFSQDMCSEQSRFGH
jgi:hypothetical protein